MGCMKNVCALAFVLCALYLGLWMRELRLFRSASSEKEWVNWIGEYSCGSSVTIQRPKTLQELQKAVRDSRYVRAAATGRSFNPFVCPKDRAGTVIDVREFKHAEILQLRDGRYAIAAEAGIEMGQLQNLLLASGLTLRIPPGNPGYSWGAVVANGCHNLGQSHAEDYLAVTFVTYDGSIREVKNGDQDWLAAGMSQGRLGVILNATIEVLPYRSFQWSAEQFPIPDMSGIIEGVDTLGKNVTSTERTSAEREVATGNKLVFYMENGVLVKEYWEAQARTSGVSLENMTSSSLPPYENPLMFRLGQGGFSRFLTSMNGAIFKVSPPWLLHYLQVPAEMAFMGMHTAASLQWVRQLVGWQHSPQSRGDMGARPSGHQFTWGAWIDEAFNWLMRLQHVEVIFPTEPKEAAARCLEAVFAYRHLFWFRLNIRVMKAEKWYLSAVHSKDQSTAFARVDFIVPGALLESSSDGAAALTKRLHTDCPGWRKHWGKALWEDSAEEAWGEPKAFAEVAARWDPEGKFEPLNMPAWLK